MNCLRIAPIVEGHGEVSSVRILLERIWYELFKVAGRGIDVLRPIREPRGRLVHEKDNALRRAVELATMKLRQRSLPGDHRCIMLLLDANSDAACILGPQILEAAVRCRSDQDIFCVLPNPEFETWFVAAAESLTADLRLDRRERVPVDPENTRIGKGWIEHRFRGPKYSETVDQPSLTSKMDLGLCRRNSPSFDKLCRELGKRIG